MHRAAVLRRHNPEADAPPLRKDALFLVASITKPVTVDRGHDARRARRADAGRQGAGASCRNSRPRARRTMQVRHLMTHTSGLPDMLADNEKLRAAISPSPPSWSRLQGAVCCFRRARKVSYQSMGTALLARSSIRSPAGRCRSFCGKEIFEPLGMNDTSLGWQPAKKERIAAVLVHGGTAPGRTGTGTARTGSASAHRGAA